ncbi:hypothetical protein [Companilactobacillus nuruki]|uniref:Uncharacterized protein n=1 Tax=Companilactobacillus nuruki TaxID=1993540 RepID=A0A2N7AWC3_9LACO|nr:hypothetical protein [Companilactobacillus nuruki]PMD73048.1 hypothetical protein CBP76_02635 [Companilactobacillus nuruki]
MTNIFEKQSILTTNYQKLTLKKRRQINKLTMSVSKPPLAPNNLPNLLKDSIAKTAKLKGLKKLSQEQYYDQYIYNFPKEWDQLLRGKDDITSMPFESYKKYFRSGGKRPNPLRLHNLLRCAYITANNPDYIKDIPSCFIYRDQISRNHF